MFRKMLLGVGLIGVMFMTSAPTYSADASLGMLGAVDDSAMVTLVAGCCAGCPATGPCKPKHRCSGGSCVEAEEGNCSPVEIETE